MSMRFLRSVQSTADWSAVRGFNFALVGNTPITQEAVKKTLGGWASSGGSDALSEILPGQRKDEPARTDPIYSLRTASIIKVR